MLSNDIPGVGVDAVDIERFRVTLARTPTVRQRLFVDEELHGAAALADPTASLAVRFAAREATMKALGVGLGAFGFHDVWVRGGYGAVPSLAVTGRAAELAADAGVSGWSLSLTHTDLVAIAFVVAR
ncbi:MAG TPA: holo-ACP synthase [Ilumatobacteraceae bacterium]|nr:holo-ACP synthase [Ilumatobacteraceae bacterium]